MADTTWWPDPIPDSYLPSGSTSDAWTQKCQSLLTQGLVPSTHWVYRTVQYQFIDFCHQDGRVNQDGSIPSANETLMHNFFIGRQPKPFLHQAYLSAVCSYHIDHGFPDPLVNCLCLQHLLRGNKQVQGPASPPCLPITVDHLKVIQCSLDLSTRDHEMLWAVCCLGFFVFLWASKFKVNFVFDPNTHMTVKRPARWTIIVLKSISSAPRQTPTMWVVIST